MKDLTVIKNYNLDDPVWDENCELEKLNPKFPWRNPMNDRHVAFREALCRLHKTERDRAESCLGDIIKIIEKDGEDQVWQILERLVEHYDRL